MEGRALTLELLGTNEAEIAYIAGLFDGEGSIGVHTTKHHYGNSKALVVSIKLTTIEPLAFCSRIFGSNVRPAYHRPNEKAMYRWELYGPRAGTCLRLIHPYLIIKKDEANLAFSFLACGKGNSPRKLELAELITPRQTKNHDINPGEPNTHQR